MTSFRIVSKVRGILNSRLGLKAKDLKVGHAGTLDPLASGVLIVCTGKATKQIDELQAGTKEYVATLKLGATTPSFDRETAEDATYPFAHITRELVEATLPKFLGRIEQIPPRFSAVKVDGKRAFKLARKGVEMELKPKILVIDEIELLSCQLEPPTPTKNQPQMTDGADSTFKPQAINIQASPSASCAAKAPISAPWHATSVKRSAVEPISHHFAALASAITHCNSPLTSTISNRLSTHKKLK